MRGQAWKGLKSPIELTSKNVQKDSPAAKRGALLYQQLIGRCSLLLMPQVLCHQQEHKSCPAYELQGCNYYILLVAQVKEADNILLVKAAATNFSETNLSVVTSDNSMYTFAVTYGNPEVRANQFLFCYKR